jgi:hypothetical protein
MNSKRAWEFGLNKGTLPFFREMEDEIHGCAQEYEVKI